MKQNTFYFKPAMQHDNTGDVLINKVLVNILKPYGHFFIDDTSKPEWFLNELGIEEDERFNKINPDTELYKHIAKECLKNLFSFGKKNCYLVFPPGHTSRKGKNNYLYGMHGIRHTAKLMFLKGLGCKMIRFGFSIGPFDDYNTRGERYRSYCFKYYAVRDTVSLKLAKDNNFNNPKLSPDLAWAYRPKNDVRFAVKKKSVILSFRSNAFGKNHEEGYTAPIIDKLVQILSHNSFAGHEIVICYQVITDRDASIEIYDALKPLFPDTKFIDHKLELDEAADLYMESSVVLSNRLHVLLLAIQAGTLAFPLISFQDNVKITSIYGDNDLNDFILDQSQDADILSDKIQKILDGEDTYLLELSKKAERNTALIKSNLDSVIKM